MFTDEFHLHTLGPFLSATAQLHPKVNIKQIVISLIDRLATYAAREAESEDPEETKRQEEAAARRLAEKVKIQKAKLRANAPATGGDGVQTVEVDIWSSEPQSPTSAQVKDVENLDQNEESLHGDNTKPTLHKFRGIPENVKLFEVFWQQIVELIKVSISLVPPGHPHRPPLQARPDLSIQDITALLVSLTNLSLSCYPDKLEYVDQILGFVHGKVKEYGDKLSRVI